MFQDTQREKLQAELAEACQHVSELQARLEKLMQEEQHQAVDDLDAHFDAVETRFKGLRTFLKTIFAEKSDPS
ncbi:MAG: hypothetical protein ACQKBY_07335 [Verrucomicrobiales bacterium]